MRRVRPLATLLVVLSAVGSTSSLASSGPLRCGTASSTVPWQSVPIPAFRSVQGVSTTDAVQAYAQDAADPSRVLVSNGTTITGSSSHGCSWTESLSLAATPADSSMPSGVAARIDTLVLLPSGRGLAALQEGAGSASRLVVLGSDTPISGGYARSDSGLPPQGIPAAFAVTPQGSTTYLAIHTVSGSTPGGPVPVLPGPLGSGGGAAAPGVAGVLYASTDGGHSWNARLSTNDPSSPLHDITALTVGGDSSLYAIAGGVLRISRDGGQSFSAAAVPQAGTVRSVAASGEEVVVSGSGGTFDSSDAGRDWTRVSPITADQVALRPGDAKIALIARGQLELVDRSTGSVSATQVVFPPALLLGDRSAAATFHAVSGHALLRYVDVTAAGGGTLPPAPVAGDTPPPPPLPGVLTPAAVRLRLRRGGSRTIDYTLRLPDDPTPLNVFFLVDVSSTLTDYQSTLNSSIRASTTALTRRRVALRVGVATLGTGPSKGKPPYPDVSPVPNYRKPTLYHLLRGLGPVDAQFYAAVGQITTETLPSPNVSGDSNHDAEEGQLLALDQAVSPRGVLDPNAATTGIPVYSVPGGQEAGFVNNPFQRNVIITATDEYFANPAGSPDKPDGSLDFDGVISRLRSFGVAGIGLTIGTTASDDGSSFNDLARVARGTGAIAPPGGIHCSADELIPAGHPIVCTDPGNFGSLLTNVLGSLRDVQSLTPRVSGNSVVVKAISAPALAAVDVTKAHTLPLKVTYSCAGLSPGVYTAGLHISLRGYDVGVGSAIVDCSAEPGPPAIRTGPVTPGVVAAQPNVVPPAAPAVPVVQPQAQPQTQPQTQAQTQAQAQPVAAVALQQQKQLQLALALQATQEEPAAAFQNDPMAMVARRRDEQAALGLLAIAMLACSAVGLARLRSSPAVRVQRVRQDPGHRQRN